MDHIPWDEPRPLITHLIPSPSVNVYPANWQQYPEFVHKTQIFCSFISIFYVYICLSVLLQLGAWQCLLLAIQLNEPLSHQMNTLITLIFMDADISNINTNERWWTRYRETAEKHHYITYWCIHKCKIFKRDEDMNYAAECRCRVVRILLLFLNVQQWDFSWKMNDSRLWL